MDDQIYPVRRWLIAMALITGKTNSYDKVFLMNIWICCFVMIRQSVILMAERICIYHGDVLKHGGPGGNRTPVHGFAIRCITTLPPDHSFNAGAGY